MLCFGLSTGSRGQAAGNQVKIQLLCDVPRLDRRIQRPKPPVSSSPLYKSRHKVKNVIKILKIPENGIKASGIIFNASELCFKAKGMANNTPIREAPATIPQHNNNRGECEAT